MGVNFQVGGSHGKIYPWVFPETALWKIDSNTAQEVQKRFTAMVKLRYVEVVRQKRAGRKSSLALSDSSTDSASVEDSAAELLRDLGYEIPWDHLIPGGWARDFCFSFFFSFDSPLRGPPVYQRAVV